MNREIKFRAWDIQNKRMIYFNAFEQWGFIDHTKDSTRSSTSCDRLMLSTDPKEFLWMQFTGLLDKNGKEIYEGDVVRIWADPKHYGGYTGHDYAEAVVWNPQEARFELTEHGFYDFEFIQVIGNIYENKELLG